MGTLVVVEGLGKRYMRRVPGARRTTLREAVAGLSSRLLATIRGKNPYPREWFWALRDVTFSLEEGHVVGLLGRNGAGKTTLLKLLAGITEPTEGRAVVQGRMGTLLGAGVGFHSELTGRENIYLASAIMGMRRSEVQAKFDEIVEFSEIGPFLDTPIKHFSRGMIARLAFSIAVHLLPEVLILDEVLAVGDPIFQDKALRRARQLSSEGRVILFVSHNLRTVQSVCTHVLILDRGRLVFWGDVLSGAKKYLELCARSRPEEPRQRTDRGGNGAVRCTSCAVYGPGGSSGITGESLSVCVGYEAKDTTQLMQLRVSVHVATMGGETLFVCSSDCGGEPVPSRGELECIVRSLPLAPATYQVHVHMWVGEDLADMLEGAAFFDVQAEAQTGPFGIGGVTGGVLVPFEWRRRGVLDSESEGCR